LGKFKKGRRERKRKKKGDGIFITMFGNRSMVWVLAHKQNNEKKKVRIK